MAVLHRAQSDKCFFYFILQDSFRFHCWKAYRSMNISRNSRTPGIYHLSIYSLWCAQPAAIVVYHAHGENVTSWPRRPGSFTSDSLSTSPRPPSVESFVSSSLETAACFSKLHERLSSHNSTPESEERAEKGNVMRSRTRFANRLATVVIFFFNSWV